MLLAKFVVTSGLLGMRKRPLARQLSGNSASLRQLARTSSSTMSSLRSAQSNLLFSGLMNPN